MLLDSLRSAPLNDLGHHDPAGHPAAQPRPTAAGRAVVERPTPRSSTSRIEAPIVVVGMMRSGTTLLQRVLASDPRLACAYGWEVGEPAPRAGLGSRRRPTRGSPTPRRARSRPAPSPPSCSPSTPPTSTRPRRRSSSWPTPSCRTSPRRPATCPATGPGSTTRTSRRPTGGCGGCSSCSSGRSGSGARPPVPSCSRRRPTSATWTRCWPSSPTPTSCTPTATRVDVIPSGASLNTTLWRTHWRRRRPPRGRTPVARADGLVVRPGHGRPRPRSRPAR